MSQPNLKITLENECYSEKVSGNEILSTRNINFNYIVTYLSTVGPLVGINLNINYAKQVEQSSY